MIFKIKRAVVLESWGSPLGVGEKDVSRSLLGAFVRGRGSWRALEKESGTLGIPWGYFRGPLFFLEMILGEVR